MVTACAAIPVKDFKTIQYLPRDGNCFERLLEDGTIEVKCYYDESGDIKDKDWITIRKSFFNKELDYQDTLKRRCKKWSQ